MEQSRTLQNERAPGRLRFIGALLVCVASIGLAACASTSGESSSGPMQQELEADSRTPADRTTQDHSSGTVPDTGRDEAVDEPTENSTPTGSGGTSGGADENTCMQTDAGCDDGDRCTVDICSPETGSCSHTPVSCEGSGDCIVDVCVGGVCVMQDATGCPPAR